MTQPKSWQPAEIVANWRILELLDESGLQLRIDADPAAKTWVKMFVDGAKRGTDANDAPIRYVDYDGNLQTTEDQFYLSQSDYDVWKRISRPGLPSFTGNTFYALLLNPEGNVEQLVFEKDNTLEKFLEADGAEAIFQRNGNTYHFPQNEIEKAKIEGYINSNSQAGYSFIRWDAGHIFMAVPKIQASACASDLDEYSEYKGYFPLDHTVKPEQVILLNDFLAAYHPGGSYGGCVVKQGEFKLQIRPDKIDEMNADLTKVLELVSKKQSLPADASQQLTAAYNLVGSLGDADGIKTALTDYKSDVEGYKPPDPSGLGDYAGLVILAAVLGVGSVIGHWGIKATEGAGTWYKVKTKGFLPSFGTNLTREVMNKAQKGEVNPYIVGENDGYIKELIALLEPPEEGIKNRSSIQRGRPGVGKTETVRYLAYLAATGGLDQLRGFEFWHLHSDKLSGEGKLSGGAKKVEWLVKEVEAAKAKGKTLVVFIDEIHRIVDVDKHSTSDISDVAERLKEHVLAGELVIVGGTTIDEYNKYIGGIPGDPKYTGNPAFAERFRVLDLREASGAQLETILDARSASIARASKVTFVNGADGKEIVDLLMKWSALVEPERAEPRRSIDLATEFVDSQRASHNPVNLPDLQPGQKVAVPAKPSGKGAASVPARTPRSNLDIPVPQFMDYLEHKLDALARTKLNSADGKTAIPMTDGEAREVWLERAFQEVHQRGAMHQQLRRIGMGGLSDVAPSAPAGSGPRPVATPSPAPVARPAGPTPPSAGTGGRGSGGGGPRAMHVEYPTSGSEALAPVEVERPIVVGDLVPANDPYFREQPLHDNVVELFPGAAEERSPIAANDGLYEPANNKVPHTHFWGELKAETAGGAVTMGLMEGTWMGVEHFTGYHPSHTVRTAVDMPALYAGTKLIAGGATLGGFAEGLLPAMVWMMPGMMAGWSGASSVSNFAGEQLDMDTLKSGGAGNRLVSAVSGGAGGAVSYKVATRFLPKAVLGRAGPLGGAIMAYPLVGEAMDFAADQAGASRDYTGRTTIQVTTSGAVGYLAHAGIQAAISGAAGTTATAGTASAGAATAATAGGGAAATVGGVVAGVSGAAIAASVAVVTAVAVTGLAVYKNATTTDEELGKERLQDNAWGRFLDGDGLWDGVDDALFGAD